MTAPSPRSIEIAMGLAQAMVAGLEAEQVDTDEDELRVLLREADVNIEDLVVRLLRTAVEAELDAEAAANRISALAARRERHVRRTKACRDTVLAIIEALPQVFPGGRVRTPEFTATVADGRQRPIVTDEQALPDDCWRHTRMPDMHRIRERLKGGGDLPGVTMSNATSVLTVRSR
jgi:hypothetical protein